MTLSDVWKYISKYFNPENKEKLVAFAVNLFFAVIIFLIFFTIGKIALNKIKHIRPETESNDEIKLRNLEIPRPNRRDNRNFSQLHRNFIAEFVFYGFILIGVMFAFTKMGFNINTLLVILGSVGIAIAFGFQNLIHQIISGINILVLRYFNIGDIVKIKENVGYIQSFNLINTTIITHNGEILLIPNNLITDDTFMNYTKNDKIFLRLDVSLSSTNRINYPELFDELVEKVSLSRYVIDKRDVYIVVSDMSQPGTKITVNAKIPSSDFFNASNEIRLIVRQTLEEQNVKLLDYSY
jgi:small conductance mechanosensitive channel